MTDGGRAERDPQGPKQDPGASRAERALEETLDGTLPGGSGKRARLPAGVECPACDRVNTADARFCAGCGHRFGGEDPVEAHDGGADPLLGRIIADRYRIEELLGRGGMGVVYRVEHIRMGKLMAMKLLHGALAGEKEVVKRFEREAEAVSRLDHPNTVQVFDFGQSQGMTYLVMEFLPGRDLGQLVKDEGALPFARVARIAIQVCGSVAQAHELGIVHRDLKPENVMVLEDRTMSDFVKVLDFGLAKLRETEEAGAKSITRAGSILGTPYYMAPEHIRGESVDERCDVYAMGALLYKAITGSPPFWASSPVGVLTMHLTEEALPPSSRNPDLPLEADRIVLEAMQKDPARRYQSMDELRQDLYRYLVSVGEAEGLESGNLMTVGGAAARTDSGRQLRLATRGDVDDFERRLRRKSRTYRFFGVTFLAALAAGGAYAWSQRQVEPEGMEREPNDELVQANPLPEGVEVRGYLGQRQDELKSDADFFVLDGLGRERRTLRFEVGAIPNMDLVVEIYREGISRPLLTADSGGVGQPEVVPNFVVDGPAHYLRIRELWESGNLPTENVSDPYTVSWRTVEPQADEEREINDSIELAETLSVGQHRRGFIGWGGDRDVYCLGADATDLVARLEPVPTLDLVLERLERSSGRVTRFDEHRAGEGERSEALEHASARSVCFEVSARRPKVGLGNDPDQPYVLHLEHGQADRDEDGSDDEGAER